MKRASFSEARLGDDREIRELLCAVPMEGAWRVGFGREPSFFACPEAAGIAGCTLVAKREGRIVSVGSWSERDVWLGGATARVGYLHGLRMAPGTPGSMRLLRDGYAALAERIAGSPAVAWFTSIDAANRRARRVLESRASGLPRYSRIADYRTRLLPVRRRGGDGVFHTAESQDELTDFLNRCGSRHDLALRWDARCWDGLASSGMIQADVRVVRRRGRIVAVAGVWDQSSWKQIILHGCPWWWRFSRPVLTPISVLAGLPRPPGAGSRLAVGHVFPFAVEPDEHGALGELCAGINAVARAKGIDWLALGLDRADPLWQTGAVPRLGVDYHTVLYQVAGSGFPGSPMEFGNRPLRPECATL